MLNYVVEMEWHFEDIDMIAQFQIKVIKAISRIFWSFALMLEMCVSKSTKKHVAKMFHTFLK